MAENNVNRQTTPEKREDHWCKNCDRFIPVEELVPVGPFAYGATVYGCPICKLPVDKLDVIEDQYIKSAQARREAFINELRAGALDLDEEFPRVIEDREMFESSFGIDPDAGHESYD